MDGQKSLNTAILEMVKEAEVMYHKVENMNKAITSISASIQEITANSVEIKESANIVIDQINKN